jgi:dihydroflavonol-4-reductase
MILGFLNGRYPAYLECMLNLIDVGDIALGHVLAAERGRIGERYILGHENMRLSAVLALIEDITGARMPRTRIPYPVALMVAAIDEFLADTITGRMPSAPLTGVRLARRPVVFDCRKAASELGLSARPIRESLTSAITWMHAQGLVHRPLPKFTMDRSTARGQTAP